MILEWILNRFESCGLDSSGSGQGPVVGSCEHGLMSLWIPLEAVNFLTIRVTVSFSAKTVLHEFS
jgi:hypothetical protein